MKVYVASKLSNIDNAKRVIEYLKGIGYEISYDWTEHGSVNGQGPVRYREVADAEMRGVVEADVVVALLPGGAGTHCEIGAAIALKKRVIVVGHHDAPYPCAFHYATGVDRISGYDDDYMASIDKVIVGQRDASDEDAASTADASQ